MTKPNWQRCCVRLRIYLIGVKMRGSKHPLEILDRCCQIFYDSYQECYRACKRQDVEGANYEYRPIAFVAQPDRRTTVVSPKINRRGLLR
jgi:hypothetical protein